MSKEPISIVRPRSPAHSRSAAPLPTVYLTTRQLGPTSRVPTTPMKTAKTIIKHELIDRLVEARNQGTPGVVRMCAKLREDTHSKVLQYRVWYLGLGVFAHTDRERDGGYDPFHPNNKMVTMDTVVRTYELVRENWALPPNPRVPLNSETRRALDGYRFNAHKYIAVLKPTLPAHMQDDGYWAWRGANPSEGYSALYIRPFHVLKELGIVRFSRVSWRLK